MTKSEIIFALLLVISAFCAQNQEYEQFSDLLHQKIRENYFAMRNCTREEAQQFHSLLLKHQFDLGEQKALKANIVPFTCTPFGRDGLEAPTSVHNVKPPFIDFIGAIGDSITAGFGAKGTSIFNMLTQFRGVSWSIGGDDDLDKGVLTLPNLFRKYNPDLYGFSTGTGDETKADARFNQAVSGAVASGLYSQAVALHTRMSVMPGWMQAYKMITIFIGGNDLCAACNDWNAYSPSNYEANVRKAINYIQDNIPNTIVNLVPVIDVTELYQLQSFTCSLLHAFECKCGTGNAQTRDQVRAMQKLYAEVAESIANDQTYNRDNFTVVLQPFMKNTFVPQLNGKPDMSFFALDCFHLSEKGHQAATVPLWDNIFEKVGQKLDYWEGPREAIDCPTKDDFIWTNRNSKTIGRK